MSGVADHIGPALLALGPSLGQGYIVAQKNRLGEMRDPIERARHYRDQAEKLRTMAESEYDDKSRKDLLVLANQYEGLAKEVLERAANKPSGLI